MVGVLELLTAFLFLRGVTAAPYPGQPPKPGARKPTHVGRPAYGAISLADVYCAYCQRHGFADCINNYCFSTNTWGRLIPANTAVISQPGPPGPPKNVIRQFMKLNVPPTTKPMPPPFMAQFGKLPPFGKPSTAAATNNVVRTYESVPIGKPIPVPFVMNDVMAQPGNMPNFGKSLPVPVPVIPNDVNMQYGNVPPMGIPFSLPVGTNDVNNANLQYGNVLPNFAAFGKPVAAHVVPNSDMQYVAVAVNDFGGQYDTMAPSNDQILDAYLVHLLTKGGGD